MQRQSNENEKYLLARLYRDYTSITKQFRSLRWKIAGRSETERISFHVEQGSTTDFSFQFLRMNTEARQGYSRFIRFFVVTSALPTGVLSSKLNNKLFTPIGITDLAFRLCGKFIFKQPLSRTNSRRFFITLGYTAKLKTEIRPSVYSPRFSPISK